MSSAVRTVDTARDLGVVIDSGLSMIVQVSAICRAAYYQLRQLRTVSDTVPDTRGDQDNSSGVHLLSSRLL